MTEYFDNTPNEIDDRADTYKARVGADCGLTGLRWRTQNSIEIKLALIRADQRNGQDGSARTTPGIPIAHIHYGGSTCIRDIECAVFALEESCADGSCEGANADSLAHDSGLY